MRADAEVSTLIGRSGENMRNPKTLTRGPDHMWIQSKRRHSRTNYVSWMRSLSLGGERCHGTPRVGTRGQPPLGEVRGLSQRAEMAGRCARRWAVGCCVGHRRRRRRRFPNGRGCPSALWVLVANRECTCSVPGKTTPCRYTTRYTPLASSQRFRGGYPRCTWCTYYFSIIKG